MRQAVRFPVRLQSGRDLIAALCVAKCQSRHNCSQPHRNNLRGYSITYRRGRAATAGQCDIIKLVASGRCHVRFNHCAAARQSGKFK